MTILLNRDGSTAVEQDTFYTPITKETKPIVGARYILINRKTGVAQIAPYREDGWYTHFAGLPKFKD